MHGLLAARLRQRTLSLAAVLTVPAAIVTAGLASAPAAQASTTAHASTTAQASTTVQASPADRTATGRLSVTIDAMTPQYAAPGATVRLSGTVTNGTRQTQAGLDVQLYTSAIHFITRDGMDHYLSSGAASGLLPAGNPFVLASSLAPGATATWTASFRVSAQGISSFGVYPVTAQLQDLAVSGDVFAAEQTLLPFWPASRAAAGLTRPLETAWLWPLIDQPHHQACAALTSNDLAAAVEQGGRLAALLDGGASHPDAQLTWVVDPALLSDVATMTRGYQAGGKANCIGAPNEPASPAAANWLAALRRITAAQPTVLTPYADVDMTALVHQGLTSDLAAAYRTGDTLASSVLHAQFGHDIAWPPGGTADLSVLTNLATAEHVGTVVLNSSEMKPLDAATVFQQDAVTSLRVAGLPMNVLLSDNTLTGVLKAGDTSSGRLPKSTEFAVRQRFLAETAMIAAEAPGTIRTIVVAPPADWSPSETLASDLLGETTTAPWLSPAPLGSLSSAADTQRTAPRQPPPASKASPGELSRGYLNQVRARGAQLGAYKAMLYQPDVHYTQSLEQALLATESAAWRGGGTRHGTALTRRLSAYLGGADKKVGFIITSDQVPMAGSSGLVPVSIQNGLLLQTVRVQVVATVDNSPGRTSQLTIGHFKDVVTIPPKQIVTVRLPVRSAPQGSTVIHLSLSSADGKTPLPVRAASLTVQSTRYGRAILVLIAAAIGVLVLTSVFRGVRRWQHDDPHLVSEEADSPGSVVTGTSDAQHPTEAPDDLADARRWVDDA